MQIREIESMEQAARLQRDLASLDCLIVESISDIARLKKTMTEMSEEEQKSSFARDLLASLVSELGQYETQRKVILEQSHPRHDARPTGRSQQQSCQQRLALADLRRNRRAAG
jgi:hypothetical protein